MTPAKLDLTLIRGITFGPIQFLFSSENLGNATVDVATNAFILTDHSLVADQRVRFRSPDGTLPTGVSAAVTYYVLAQGLMSFHFMVSTTLGGSPLVLTDTGTGTLQVLVPADMTGYIPSSEVRDEPNGKLITDLLPVLTDATIGELTIPVIPPDQSILLPADSGLVRAKWDIVFVIPTGERIGPYIAGSFFIKSIITEKAPLA
jgi:hypothetical protein